YLPTEIVLISRITSKGGECYFIKTSNERIKMDQYVYMNMCLCNLCVNTRVCVCVCVCVCVYVCVCVCVNKRMPTVCVCMRWPLGGVCVSCVCLFSLRLCVLI